MARQANAWLITGAALSAVAAALHLAIMWGGPSWYRFFGAGENMAKLAEAGHWYPPLLTSGIALLLGLWAVYALSAAGVAPRLPLLRPALCVIAGIYLLRGLVILPLFLMARDQVTPFWIWSSAICLAYGIVHLVGLRQVWPAL